MNVPEAFEIFLWLVFSASILVGGIYGFIHLGWVLYYKIDLMDDQKRAEEEMLKARAAHQKRMLDLEFDKAKAVSDSIIAAGRE